MKKSSVSTFVMGGLCCTIGVVIGLLLRGPYEVSVGDSGSAKVGAGSVTDREQILRMFAKTSPDDWLSRNGEELGDWALEEPERVLRFIESLSLKSSVKTSAVLLVYEKLISDGKYSADELFTLAQSLPRDLRFGALSPLYEHGNADLSLEERWDWITQKSDGLGMNLKHAAFRHLAEQAKDSEVAQLKALVLAAPSEIRSDLAQGLISRLTKQDPVGAFRWAFASETREVLAGDEWMMIPVLEAPEAVFDEVLNMGNDPSRGQLLEMVISEIPSLDISQMKKVLEVSGDSVHPAFRQRLLGKVFETNPNEALEWGEDLPFGKKRDEALRSLAMMVSEKDATKALAWLNDLPSDHSKFLALQEVSREQARQDPRKALEAITTIGDPRRRHEMEQIVAFEWGYQEPEVALAWAATLSGTDRDAVESVVLKGALHKSPADFDRLANAMVDERDPEMVRPELGAALAGISLQDGKSPDAMIERYREHIGTSEAFDEMVVKNAIAKITTDVKGASEWIATLPVGAPRDRSVSYLVRRLAAVEPDSATAWALEIGDPALRRSMIEAVRKASPLGSPK